MDLERWLFLTMTARLKGQRTGNGAVHLLSGKRSAQTLQDASLFYVLPLTASLKHRSPAYIHEVRSDLSKAGLVTESHRGLMTITKSGRGVLKKLDEKYFLPEKYNAGRFEWSGEAEWFWKRLSLYIQSLSNVLDKSRKFVPVHYDYDVQEWVRRHFPGTQEERAAAASRLYRELKASLEAIEEEYAYLFVSRLSSSSGAGQTYTQLAGEGGDPSFTYIKFRTVLHHILNSLQEKNQFSVLASFVKPEEDRLLMTRSAGKTLDLLKKGMSLEEVRRIRNLQRSTVEDHAVEIAKMHPSFEAGMFADSRKLRTVEETAVRLGTNRLKIIKDELGEEYDYFTIRLALAEKKGETHAGTIRT
ncbi:hypothetical protein CR205_07675 [Alteribacter lacisalsi]|uniref:Helicase Helix-turn-helix domain-containing protein n=1 Tax=Alteribacter lacisalsi TaxID=2045244 RepID=A0A2W0HC68_9BACI|nr:helix-turn-helix domain-containing protein [Alteribacter lacisalsi]PYZ98461.1 hypothetical protein CR205_07675 [Alteribacter lacisalsi]